MLGSLQAVIGSTINTDVPDNSETKTRKSVNKKRFELLTRFYYTCMPIARYPYTYAYGCLHLGLVRRPKDRQRNFS
jgi:hypothetical protein